MAISITPLSGGNTPADGSDPRTFPAIWNATATQLEGVADDLDTLEATTLTGVNVASPVEGDSLVYDGTDWVNSSNVVSGRNLLYNGAMQVSQRANSATGITTFGYYTADRWNVSMSSAGTWTQSLEDDGPTGSGFGRSLKMECTTAKASLAAGDYALIRQKLEGKDVQVIKKGTSSAESLTLQFWVKSNNTGTYAIVLSDRDNTREIAATYTIDAAGVWEKKVITFEPDTTGALNNTANEALYVLWYLAAGTDYTSGTLQTAWASTVEANRAVGQANLADSVSNYWQMTGVQLETGTTANGYEHTTQAEELAKCQRYYTLIASASQRAVMTGYANTTTSCQGVFNLPVTMRVPPSVESASGTNYYRFNSTSNSTVDSVSLLGTFNSIQALGIYADLNTTNTAGHGGVLRTNLADAYVAADAEL